MSGVALAPPRQPPIARGDLAVFDENQSPTHVWWMGDNVPRPQQRTAGPMPASLLLSANQDAASSMYCANDPASSTAPAAHAPSASPRSARARPERWRMPPKTDSGPVAHGGSTLHLATRELEALRRKAVVSRANPSEAQLQQPRSSSVFGGPPRQAAASAVVAAVRQLLAPQLRHIDEALATGRPTPETCAASLEVLLLLRGWVPPLEEALSQIAQTVKHTARVGLQEPAGGGEVSPYYFSLAETQQQAVADLTAERDAAVARCVAQRRRAADIEAALAQTKQELAAQTEQIDSMLREHAIRQAELHRVRHAREQQDMRYHDLLATQGHSTRMTLEEQQRLQREQRRIAERLEHHR